MNSSLLKLIVFVTKRMFQIFLVQTIAMQFLMAESGYGQGLETIKISIQRSDMSIEEMLLTLERESGFQFGYSIGILQDRKKYSLDYQEATLDRVLLDLSEKAQLKFKRINRTIYVKKRKASKAGLEETRIQESRVLQKVTGKIMDEETGDPLIGAVIKVQNYSLGAVTDLEGEFTLDVPEMDATLEISYLGYTSQEVQLDESLFGDEKGAVLEVYLSHDLKALSEVVVIGYGSVKKEDLTGAVSSVSEDDFNKGIINSPEQLLQGKLSGVRISNTSGEPGAGFDIVIRGVNSIRNNNTPLFVIDGLPLDNGAISSGSSLDQTGSSSAQNPLTFLNPNDIESIQVLKDASAAAIYGSRGANGVIIIKTKKGSAGASTLNYNNYFSVAQVANTLPLLNGEEFRQAQIALGNGERSDVILDDNASVDWQDLIFRPAVSQSHNLAFNHGTENTSVGLSLGLLDQEGIVEENELRRVTGRIHFGHTMKEGLIRLEGSLLGSFTRTEGVPITNSSGSGGDLLVNTIRANPTAPIPSLYNPSTGINPLTMLDIYTDQTETDRLLGNFAVIVKPIKNLEYKLSAGIDRSNSTRAVQTLPPGREDVFNPNGFIGVFDRERQSRLLDNYITYKMDFDRYGFTVTGGYSYQDFERISVDQRHTDLDVSDLSLFRENPLENLSLAATQLDPGGDRRTNNIQSLFGRLIFDFDDRYLLTATLRRDGSNVFVGSNKFSLFPSAALAWKLHNEPFFNSEIINQLKFRASWGQTGNQEIPAGAATGISRRVQSGVDENGEAIFRTQQVLSGNPDVQWEVTTQSTLAVDFSLFDNRIYGNIDAYRKVTTDLLFQIDGIFAGTVVPGATASVWDNIDARIINNGIDFLIGGIPVRNDNFSWDLSINGGLNKNKVKDLDIALPTGQLGGPGITGTEVLVYQNNESIGSFLLREHAGFDENGQQLFENDGELAIVGNALPYLHFGINSVFYYKNFDLSLNFTGSVGNKVYNNTAAALLNRATFNTGANVTREVVNSPESVTTIPDARSDFYLEDGSFFRLNNITLGYGIDVEKVRFLSEARVYISGQNLFVITDYSGYDPEVNTDRTSSQGYRSFGIDFTSYPKARTISMGVSVTL